MTTVFVCDGESKAALGITRSLGKKGIRVIVGSQYPIGRAQLSKYCAERVVYPDPHKEAEFLVFIHDYLKTHSINVLIPVSYATCRLFSKFQVIPENWNTRIPVASWPSMNIASDKALTTLLAERWEVPCPKINPGTFPVVVKSDTESKFLRFVNSAEELTAIDMADKTAYEYIPGQGYGYVALFDRGEPVIDFMHMRVREYPITGGPSTFAKAVYYSELVSAGRKLFKALKWHGVGMCEFKRDNRDGKFKLIEINPKFWGSLDLALIWGVDFPYYLVQMAMGKTAEEIRSEREISLPSTGPQAKMFRWLFPYDILALLADPKILPVWLDDLFNYHICRYSYDRSDPLPELYNVLITPYAVMKAVRAGLKYPNGKPVVK